MALILEVLEEGGAVVRARVRLDALPVSVGRALDNDLVLDDPYVDARHARITRDADGVVVVEDLGSLNGLVLAGPGRQVSAPARPGVELRLGRTTIRFRDSAESVPAALPDRATARTTGAGWFATTRARAAVVVGATCGVGLYGWLASYERSGGTDALAGAVALLMFGALWAGVWAVAGRIVVHRFDFLGHFAVLAAVAAAAMAASTLSAWAIFLWPANPLASSLGVALSLSLLAVLVVGHLGLATTLPRARRWRAGVVTSAVVGLVILAFALVDDDTFTDVPTFHGVLKPLPAALVPALTPGEFSVVVEELREEVDRMAAKNRP